MAPLSLQKGDDSLYHRFEVEGRLNFMYSLDVKKSEFFTII
jgi:hypothetical protein